MAAVAAAGIPVPRVFAEGIWDKRPALLMSWMPGRLLRHELEGRTWRSWDLGVQFGRVQAAIHAAPVPAALRRPPGLLDRVGRTRCRAPGLLAAIQRGGGAASPRLPPGERARGARPRVGGPGLGQCPRRR